MLVDMISKAFLKCYVAFFNVLYWKIDELYTALNVHKAKENNQNRLQKHFDSSKRLAKWSDLFTNFQRITDLLFRAEIPLVAVLRQLCNFISFYLIA